MLDLCARERSLEEHEMTFYEGLLYSGRCMNVPNKTMLEGFIAWEERLK